MFSGFTFGVDSISKEVAGFSPLWFPRGKFLVDSIMDHLKKPKEMFDSLTKLFEGKNINQKMTLRKQLKNVKIHNAETIQSYITRVSQIKEQLEVVEEEVENEEVVITTLNGLLRSWDSFIQRCVPEGSDYL